MDNQSVGPGRALEILQKLAEADQHFTLPQVRTMADIPPKGPAADKLWALWKSLQELQAIEELPTSRRRNRVYHVKRPELLHVMTPLGKPQQEPAPRADIPVKLVERLLALEARVSHVESSLITLQQQLVQCSLQLEVLEHELAQREEALEPDTPALRTAPKPRRRQGA